jgi:hypothetical protein
VRRVHSASRIIFLEYLSNPTPPLPILAECIDTSRRELKTCEWCGTLFTRITPRFAFEGQKICPQCIKSPPPIPEDEPPPQRVFRCYAILR